MQRLLLAVVLASCSLPDSVSTGISQRFETFDEAGGILDSNYSGQQIYVSGTWHLKPTPMLLDYTPGARLFLTEMDRHSAPGSSVNVHTPANEAPKGVIGEVGDLLDRGRDSNGDYTLPGVLALLVVALLATVLMMLRSRPKDTP